MILMVDNDGSSMENDDSSLEKWRFFVDEQGKREMAARKHATFNKAGEIDAGADDDVVEDYASVELTTAQLLALGKDNPASVGLPMFIKQAEKQIPAGFTVSFPVMRAV